MRTAQRKREIQEILISIFCCFHLQVPATPDISDRQLRACSTKFDGASVLKRCGSNSNFRDIIDLDRANGGSNWLDRWMEESLLNNRRDSSLKNVHADDEKSDKILEVDTWKPHLKSQQSNRSSQTPQHVFSSDFNKESFMTYNSPTKAPNPVPAPATQSSRELLSLNSLSLGKDEAAAARTAENSPQMYSATSRPGSSARRGPFTPARSECAWGFLSGYSGHPNYMSNTESSRAKVRSQSAPRQRLEFENFGSTRRSVQGFWDAGINADRGFSPQAYPASTRLNRVGSSSFK
ncbi:protein IQ-DOMAIN 24-like [Corylus avellana]|uniref:protein IQ-DOMAIN 24-like n=1 Tax=Corylus avellana TaxID=13451 RepID=UPI00286B0885|nr:protein IQ-DOMAIN 24-like [Corylus avellana]